MADKPKTNVDKFFEIYDADPALQARVQQAMDCYPGSLEIRDVMTEHVLLPVAEELGLPFTLKELRNYELLKWGRQHQDRELTDDEMEARTGWCAPFASYSISLQPASDILHIALHALDEQRGVEAVGHGVEAPAEAVDHAVGRAGEEHAVLSGRVAGGDDARDGRLKFRRVELPRHAHRDRQVRHGAEPIKAPAVLARRAEAPLADGVIFRVVHELLHLLERLDVRHDQALYADVEQLEHGGAADLAHARERADAAQLGGAHERGGGLSLDGGVLVVDDGKVEPRAAEALHEAHAGGVKKGADGLRAGGKFLFECVFHADSSLSCLDAPIIRAFWRDGKHR